MKKIGLLLALCALGGLAYSYSSIKEFQQLTAENGPAPDLVVRILVFLFSSIFLAAYIGANIASFLGRSVIDLLFHVHSGPPLKTEEEGEEEEETGKDSEEEN